jgi:hypothetical protein
MFLFAVQFVRAASTRGMFSLPISVFGRTGAMATRAMARRANGAAGFANLTVIPKGHTMGQPKLSYQSSRLIAFGAIRLQ